MKVFGHQNFQILCRELKETNWQFLIWHFRFPAWNLKFFEYKYLCLKPMLSYLASFKNEISNLPSDIIFVFSNGMCRRCLRKSNHIASASKRLCGLRFNFQLSIKTFRNSFSCLFEFCAPLGFDIK